MTDADHVQSAGALWKMNPKNMELVLIFVEIVKAPDEFPKGTKHFDV